MDERDSNAQIFGFLTNFIFLVYHLHPCEYGLYLYAQSAFIMKISVQLISFSHPSSPVPQAKLGV
jgi:hypothetical protein